MGAAQSTATTTCPTSSIDEKLAGALAEGLASVQLSDPVSDVGSISKGNLDNWEDKLAKDAKNVLARNIFVDTDFNNALNTRQARIADPHMFNLSLEFKTDPITSQKSSGRCWLFATTNVLRYSVMKKLNLKEFQRF